MTQKIKVPFGFTHMDIGGILFLYVIKLRFNPSSVDNKLKMFFTDLKFTSYNTLSSTGKQSVVFLYHTSNYTEYEALIPKVREHLIRRKISGLYDQLASINPTQQILTTVEL